MKKLFSLMIISTLFLGLAIAQGPTDSSNNTQTGSSFADSILPEPGETVTEQEVESLRDTIEGLRQQIDDQQQIISDLRESGSEGNSSEAGSLEGLENSSEGFNESGVAGQSNDEGGQGFGGFFAGFMSDLF